MSQADGSEECRFRVGLRWKIGRRVLDGSAIPKIECKTIGLLFIVPTVVTAVRNANCRTDLIGVGRSQRLANRWARVTDRRRITGYHSYTPSPKQVPQVVIIVFVASAVTPGTDSKCLIGRKHQ